MFEDYPDIVTFEDVCKMLSLSRNTVYGLLRKKKIKNKKIGMYLYWFCWVSNLLNDTGKKANMLT